MAPKQTRDDARTLASEHGGKAYTNTMTSPRIKADGTPIDKHIQAARKVGTVEQTTIVAGFVTPASFRIDGLSRPVTFSTGIRSPFGGGLTITTLTIDHDRANKFGMNQLADNDLPNFSTLLRHALTIATCLVKVKASPPVAVGSPITPAMFAGTVIKVGSGHISPSDRLRALGKAKQASDKDDKEPMFSVKALREVAKAYKAAPTQYETNRQPRAAGQGIEQYIASDIGRSPGAVRRMITECAKRGYITDKDKARHKRGKQ
jgi:hypothetical protein